MKWWRPKHKQDIIEHADAEKRSDIEVTQMKSTTHSSVKQANKQINSLNKLLKADGITLKIYIASGGGRGK